MIEDQLHNAMSRHTADTEASRDILHRAQMKAMQRRQRRDTIRVGVGASVFSVLAVVGVMTLHGGSFNGAPTTANNGANVAQGPQTIQLTAKLEATDAPATPPTAGADRPTVLVGAAASGRLVTIDTQSGATTKLLTKVDAGALIGGVSLSSDTKTVYFDVKTGSACAAQIRSIPTAGGAVSEVVDGSTPSISPDGKSLAYISNATCGAPQVVIKSLSQNTSSVVADAGHIGATSVAAISWSPDGKKLALDLRFPSDADGHIVLVNASAVNDLAQVQLVNVPSSDKAGTVYEWPTFVDNTHLFVSERCCTSAGSGNSDSSRMVITDLNGTVTSLVATGYLTKAHTDMDSDISGNHLLYLSGQDLMVSDRSDRPAPLAHGLIGATWH